MGEITSLSQVVFCQGICFEQVFAGLRFTLLAACSIRASLRFIYECKLSLWNV